MDITNQEDLRSHCRRLCEECGLSVNFIIISTDQESLKLTGLEIYHSNDDLSFDTLEKLAVAFKSKLIDLYCVLGTESDRSHDPIIRIREPFQACLSKGSAKEIERLRAGLLEIAAIGEEPFNRQSVRAREILINDSSS